MRGGSGGLPARARPLKAKWMQDWKFIGAATIPFLSGAAAARVGSWGGLVIIGDHRSSGGALEKRTDQAAYRAPLQGPKVPPAPRKIDIRTEEG